MRLFAMMGEVGMTIIGTFKSKKLKNRFRLSVVTSESQRKSLEAIRRELASQEFLIFDVALWYRRSEDDFLAVKKDTPSNMLLIRPGRNDVIEFRPYVRRVEFHHQWRKIAEHKQRVKFGKIRWGKQLLTMVHAGGWRDYIPEDQKSELVLASSHI